MVHCGCCNRPPVNPGGQREDDVIKSIPVSSVDKTEAAQPAETVWRVSVSQLSQHRDGVEETGEEGRDEKRKRKGQGLYYL